MARTVDEHIDEIIDIIKKDTFNLTRDDQDAICLKLEELRRFIQVTYEQHKTI